MSAAITVEGVSKRFRLQADRPSSIKEFVTRRDRDKAETHFWALDDVSIEIEQGSMYALVGHNGSGKSTLLRCIAGIYQPDAGHVTANGRISTLLELGAGFHPDLSGRENVYLNATILGMSKHDIDLAFDDIVSFAGVEKFIDSPVKVYSSGMYVRLGFSVAVHVRPEILIIDEVIAVGDEQFQRQCFEHLYRLRKDGVTIVVVTHGMATVQNMCDSAAWLDHGVLQKVGDAPEVALSYLQHVNRVEADKLEAAMTDGSPDVAAGSIEISDAGPNHRKLLTDVGEHRGDGEMSFTSVELLDGDGRATTSIGEHDPMTIRLHYRSLSRIENPIFGFALHTETGIHLTGTNTRLAGTPTGIIDGDGHVDYHIGQVPLLAGNYELTIAIEDQHSQHIFDRYDRSFRIRIHHSGEQAVEGLFDMGGGWKNFQS